jgi:hypothetical protein
VRRLREGKGLNCVSAPLHIDGVLGEGRVRAGDAGVRRCGVHDYGGGGRLR